MMTEYLLTLLLKEKNKKHLTTQDFVRESASSYGVSTGDDEADPPPMFQAQSIWSVFEFVRSTMKKDRRPPKGVPVREFCYTRISLYEYLHALRLKEKKQEGIDPSCFLYGNQPRLTRSPRETTRLCFEPYSENQRFSEWVDPDGVAL